MKRWWQTGPLMDEAGEGGGGGTAVADDPGAPRELDDELDHEDDERSDETDDQRTIRELREQLTSERGARSRAEDDARYWNSQARQRPQQQQREQPQERQEREELQTHGTKELTGEELITLFAQKGVAAFKELGFVTQKELNDAVTQARREATEEFNDNLAARDADRSFEGTMAKEFPELLAESKRIERGARPSDPLFIRTGEIVQEMVAMDPSLDGSPSVILIAARQAKREGVKPTRQQTQTRERDDRGDRGTDDTLPHVASRQTQRRERIERQRPSQSADRGEEQGDDMATSDQMHVAKMLKVSSKDLTRQLAGGGRSSGRRR